MPYQLSDESVEQAKRVKENPVMPTLHPMWKCGKCGVEFGAPSEHAQAPNQCPNCLANIQTAGLPTVAEEKVVEEVGKMLEQTGAIVEDQGTPLLSNIESSGEQIDTQQLEDARPVMLGENVEKE